MNTKQFFTNQAGFCNHGFSPFKIIIPLLIILCQVYFVCPAYAISDFKQGTGTDAVQGTDNVSDIDANLKAYLQDPLDILLTHHIWGITFTHTSDDVLTLSAGEVTCSNGAGTIRRMRKNTATTTVDFTAAGVGGIDSGSARVVSTWYDVYAVADANATTFTAIAAQQGVALSDVTYYRYVGSVYNNAADNIANFYWFGNGTEPLVMWDVPIQVTAVLSAGAWSGAIDCSIAMPSSSTLGIFGLAPNAGAGTSPQSFIRPNGSTWTTNPSNAFGAAANAVNGGQRICATDSAQDIQHYESATTTTIAISVEGFYLKR